FILPKLHEVTIAQIYDAFSDVIYCGCNKRIEIGISAVGLDAPSSLFQLFKC
ncbi:1167_t:CDS:1, partial [Rhizophagus irregularis]